MSLKFIPYNPELTVLAKKNRKNPTPAETKFYFKILKEHPFNLYKFTKQKPLLNFILDFYCSKLKLAVEIDGDTHAEQKIYDDIRTSNLKNYGIQIIRYNNSDVLNNIEGVYEDFKNKLFELREC